MQLTGRRATSLFLTASCKLQAILKQTDFGVKFYNAKSFKKKYFAKSLHGIISFVYLYGIHTYHF
jgi:hypothetical protein